MMKLFEIFSIQNNLPTSKLVGIWAQRKIAIVAAVLQVKAVLKNKKTMIKKTTIWRLTTILSIRQKAQAMVVEGPN